MKPKERRKDYKTLGNCLKEAREKLSSDIHIGRSPSPQEMAALLDVSRGFVCQVEQGIRKPKDGDIGKWASVYGVKPEVLWKCLHRIPMDMVRTLRVKPKPIEDDPFLKLAKEDKEELLPYLDYIRWKRNNKLKLRQ